MGLMGSSGLSARKIIGLIYPVGSIYMSTVDITPAAVFGGEWEAIRGKFLLAESDNHAAGSTGGEETHTLTVQEIPAHNHTPVNGGSFASDGGGPSAGFGGGSYWYKSPSTGSVGGSKPHNNMPP